MRSLLRRSLVRGYRFSPTVSRKHSRPQGGRRRLPARGEAAGVGGGEGAAAEGGGGGRAAGGAGAGMGTGTRTRRAALWQAATGRRGGAWPDPRGWVAAAAGPAAAPRRTRARARSLHRHFLLVFLGQSAANDAYRCCFSFPGKDVQHRTKQGRVTRHEEMHVPHVCYFSSKSYELFECSRWFQGSSCQMVDEQHQLRNQPWLYAD
ncbi:hypothetical protein PVAP13_2KG576600 [Panicum virgatum]|uniref:Uncharacterized protein n=1 Tax=Panicum virgatum TaxID=38727 RepID=A0A8T0WJJ9_PANVG|nr:hypothetical protein PVAP13_2KG576600 [Panicum virgatum]